MANYTNSDHIYRALFEMSSQMKFRYPLWSTTGEEGRNVTTEDLWDMSPAELDLIYVNLQMELREVDESGLIPRKSADDGVRANDIRNKMEIVKYIFESKKHSAVLERMAFEK